MKTSIQTLAALALLCAPFASANVSGCEPPRTEKRTQVSDEQHRKNLAAKLPLIQASKSVGLMNWHRDRMRDKNEGWVKIPTLAPEQMAEVQPIIARMKVNPKASLKPTMAGSCGFRMPMTNWSFTDAAGKTIFVSQSHDISADPNSGADWLLSAEDMAALTAIVDKYIAAAQ